MGAQIGLTPQEVLDMSLDMFQACVDGYSDHMFDLQLLAVHQGYWAGYFGASKKPKPLNAVLTQLVSNHTKKDTQKHVDTVDVEAFERMDAQFNQRLQAFRKRGGTNG